MKPMLALTSNAVEQIRFISVLTSVNKIQHYLLFVTVRFRLAALAHRTSASPPL